jgi:hypothetical protein
MTTLMSALLMRRRSVAIAIAIAITGCGGSTPTAFSAADDLAPEQRLAVIHGDPDAERDFAAILDRMEAGVGNCNPVRSRRDAAYVIAVSWRNSGEGRMVLEYAQDLVEECRG